MSSICTCVAPSFSTSVDLRVSGVMPVDACVRVASTSVRALILVECRTLVISMPNTFCGVVLINFWMMSVSRIR